MTIETKESCIPAHPQVAIKLYKKHQNVLPNGMEYDPKTGYTIEEPRLREHNGTYLCVFTDNSGTKVSKLVINLIVQTKEKKKIYLEGINIKTVRNNSMKWEKSQRLFFIFFLIAAIHSCINCVLFYGNEFCELIKVL